MKKFQIESEAGVVMGIYEGETKEDAVLAMRKDAGYATHEAALEVTGKDDIMDGLIVIEVRKYECDRDAVSHLSTGDRQTIEAVSAGHAREQYAAWLTECDIEHSEDDISVTLIDWEE